MESININMENLNKKERATLINLIAKSQQEVWRPKQGDRYWYINTMFGTVSDTTWTNSGSDETRYNIGNCYADEEKANFEMEAMLYQAKWKRLAIKSGEKENPWDDKSAHWYVGYNKNSELALTNSIYCHTMNTFFASEESLKEAIAILGEENVKKYILRMK